VIFLNRRSREGGGFLDWKIRLFFAGAILALVGMAWESAILVGAAVAALLMGLALRFFGRGGEGEADDA